MPQMRKSCLAAATLVSMAVSTQAGASLFDSCQALNGANQATPETAALKAGDLVHIGNTTFNLPVLWQVTNTDTHNTVQFTSRGGGRYTIPADGTYQILIGGLPAKPLIYCTPYSSQASTTALQLRQRSHGAALASALRTVHRLRFDRDRTGVHRDGQFWARPEGDNGENLWTQIDLRRLSGTQTGDSLSFSVGADWPLGPSGYLGLAMSHSRFDISADGLVEAGQQTSLSPYFGMQQGGWDLSGYAQIGRGDHRIDGVEVQADSLGFGLRAAVQLETGTLSLQPFASFQYTQEDLPSYSIGTDIVEAHRRQERSLQLGLAVALPQDSHQHLRPYGSLAVEFGRSNAPHMPTDRFVKPRIVLGVETTSGAAGGLKMELEYGHSGRGTKDLTLRGGVQIAL